MALTSARMAGINVPQETVDRADKWLTSVGGGEHGGLCGYVLRGSDGTDFTTKAQHTWFGHIAAVTLSSVAVGKGSRLFFL